MLANFTSKKPTFNLHTLTGVNLMTKFALRNNLLKAYTVAAFTTLAVVTISTGQAQAVVVTFDDLPETLSPIPNGYGGLNWNNFYHLNGSLEYPYGYFNGTVSTPNVAFNAYGNPASVSIGSGQFDFNSAYLTAAWNNKVNILVKGLLGGTVKYSTTVTVDTTHPRQFNFNFLAIDNLKFKSLSYDHFALDNFDYKAVPEPFTILGSLTAAGFGAALRRKQKQQQKDTVNA
jgi:hypothetical protein